MIFNLFCTTVNVFHKFSMQGQTAKVFPWIPTKWYSHKRFAHKWFLVQIRIIRINKIFQLLKYRLFASTINCYCRSNTYTSAGSKLVRVALQLSIIDNPCRQNRITVHLFKPCVWILTSNLIGTCMRGGGIHIRCVQSKYCVDLMIVDLSLKFWLTLTNLTVNIK